MVWSVQNTVWLPSNGGAQIFVHTSPTLGEALYLSTIMEIMIVVNDGEKYLASLLHLKGSQIKRALSIHFEWSLSPCR
ncbi:hypothetical protein [Acinetobacter equi]|uniref:Uncharacterized protein n=1 Tax=Acinetobacter equi TaxID=1324350 RepID=A0A0N7GXU3_9GAMM|nr:hypothetical protein [Acinetobacter equi]ALH95675.1 hypothetical protein AOY20_09105 [Acinetobacter equi]